MSKATETNPLIILSDGMADAVEKSRRPLTVMVGARRRFPASGIIYAAGLVLTADHVVEQDEAIRVLLPDGSETKARVAGRDPGSDLAVLRLENGGPAGIARVAAQAARVGQLALAVGRPSPDGVQASPGRDQRPGRAGAHRAWPVVGTLPAHRCSLLPGFLGVGR